MVCGESEEFDRKIAIVIWDSCLAMVRAGERGIRKNSSRVIADSRPEGTPGPDHRNKHLIRSASGRIFLVL